MEDFKEEPTILDLEVALRLIQGMRDSKDNKHNVYIKEAKRFLLLPQEQTKFVNPGARRMLEDAIEEYSV